MTESEPARATVPVDWPGWRWPTDRQLTTRLRTMLRLSASTPLWPWIQAHAEAVRDSMGITNQLILRGYRQCRYRDKHNGVSSQLLDATNPRGWPVVVKVVHLASSRGEPLSVGYGYLELAVHSLVVHQPHLLGWCDAPLVASVGALSFGRMGMVLPRATEDLGQALRHHTLSSTLVLQWTRELVAALRYLHRHHIAHMDLKPENVLVGPGDTLRLCDFGHSYFVRGQTHFDAMKQTAWYRSPELLAQASHHLATYDPLLTDRWALGLLLWDLVIERPLLSRTCSLDDGKAFLAYLWQHVRLWQPEQIVRHYTIRAGLEHDWVLWYLREVVGPLVTWEPRDRADLETVWRRANGQDALTTEDEPPAATMEEGAQPGLQWMAALVPRVAQRLRVRGGLDQWLQGAQSLWQRLWSRRPTWTPIEQRIYQEACVSLAAHVLFPWVHSPTIYEGLEWTQPHLLPDAELRLADRLDYRLLW